MSTVTAALTFWPVLAIVLTAAGTLSAPVVVWHIACEIRIGRARRRDRELIAARRAAHQERKWAQIASDDQAIAAARAERDEARAERDEARQEVEQLELTVVHLRGQLQGAQAVMSRLNRPQLQRLAHAIEAEHVRTQPMPKVPALTHQVPAIEAPARRRPVLA